MATKKPRESLVDWVVRNAPLEDMVQPRKRQARPTAPPAPAGQESKVTPRYVTLQEWAAAVFGEHAPHQNTLIRWAKEGYIQPQPRKIGRRWWATPAAEYRDD